MNNLLKSEIKKTIKEFIFWLLLVLIFYVLYKIVEGL